MVVRNDDGTVGEHTVKVSDHPFPNLGDRRDDPSTAIRAVPLPIAQYIGKRVDRNALVLSAKVGVSTESYRHNSGSYEFTEQAIEVTSPQIRLGEITDDPRVIEQLRVMDEDAFVEQCTENKQRAQLSRRADSRPNRLQGRELRSRTHGSRTERFIADHGVEHPPQNEHESPSVRAQSNTAQRPMRRGCGRTEFSYEPD